MDLHTQSNSKYYNLMILKKDFFGYGNEDRQENMLIC